MISWQWPWMLLLLPLPLLLRSWFAPFESVPASVRVPFYNDLTTLPDQRVATTSMSKLVIIFGAVSWLMLLTAASRPMWFGEPIAISTSGRDLLLAVDLSDSMRIDDMSMIDTSGAEQSLTRMQAIKQVAGDFIQRRRGDRVGLILFGQRSYLQTPLTFDSDSVVIQLQEALPGFAGSSTAIGDAIGLAISTLRDRTAESRVLVLLTDGENTAGSEPSDALQVAAEAGIRIHTIGIGATSMMVRDVSGNLRKINPSKDLDEAMLQTIADATGGQYFRAQNPTEMAAIYEDIESLEPMQSEKFHRPQRSLYHWPLAVALISTLIMFVVRARVQQ